MYLIDFIKSANNVFPYEIRLRLICWSLGDNDRVKKKKKFEKGSEDKSKKK